MVALSLLGPAAERVPDVDRIAVLRANALGDFIFVLPALDALRAAYPEAEIVLLGAPWHAKLWRDRPGPVDRVLVVPPADGIRYPEPDEEPAAMDDFLATARTERFDLALQLHGGGANSNPLVAALGARVTAGLRAENAPPLDRWIRYVYYQHEVIRYLEVAALVGAPATTIVPTLAVTASDRAEAERVLGPARRPRVALHPGATDTRRRWPAERFGEVARELTGDGYEVLVTGTPSEREVVDRVVEAAGVPLRPQVGTLSLGGLAGCFADCALVISNDTGPLHLAAPSAPRPSASSGSATSSTPRTRCAAGTGRSARGPCTARSAGWTARPASTRTAPATANARTGTRSSPTCRWPRCWKPPASC